MKQTKRFCLALFALLLGIGSTWATTTIYPTANRLCRNGSSTTWTQLGTTMTPVDGSESFTTFELKYRSSLYAIMQFEVPNFKAVKTMSLIFTKDNAATKMGVWNYSGKDMPQNNGTSATYTYQQATAVLGVSPGTKVDDGMIEPLAQGDSKEGVWTFAIDANAIASSVVYKGDTAVVQLLLTTYTPSRDAASKIFAYNADQTKTPHLDIEYVDYAKPVQEICYRTNSAGTGWNDTSFPKMPGASNNFEIAHSSRLCAVYQFWIQDFDKSKNYTFKITKSQQEADVYAWEFPYALPQKNSDSPIDFISNVTSVTGVALGTASGSGTYKETYLAKATRTSGVATFAIKGCDIKNLTTDARGNKVLTLLVTSQLGGNYKCYNSLSNIEDAKKPNIAFAGYTNVYNETQDIAYDSLQTACREAAAGDVIRVNNDLKTDKRVDIMKNPVTIYGRTADTKINFTTRGEFMFLIKDFSAAGSTTIKNLQLVNDATKERDKLGIEVFKPTILENVTFVSASGYNPGIYDIYARTANVVLVGNNVLPGGIKIANGKRIDDGISGASPRTTHTTPIVLTMETIAENTMVVAHGWGTRKDMYQLTNEGYALYVNASNGDLKAFQIQPITLAETADNAALLSKYKGIETDITLTRTIAASTSAYSTFCVPFETTKSELGAAEVLAYTGATISGEEAILNFEDVETLEAGKPYLVRFDAEYKNPVFNGKTITAATAGKYGDSNFEFVGLYSQTKITTDQTQDLMYLGAANQLYWADANCTINGLRGYFEAISAPAVAARRLTIGRGTATGINQQSAISNQQSKVLRNGQLIIIRDGKQFNAQGQAL